MLLITTRRVVRNAPLVGLHLNLEDNSPGIEKVIDLLTQSKLAQYLVRQSIPKIASNSDMDRTTKLVGKFLSFKV